MSCVVSRASRVIDRKNLFFKTRDAQRSNPMQFKVKIIESTSPYELEKRINEALRDIEVRGYDVFDIKYVMTPMAGAKVSRGGVFYLASILFKKN